MLRECSLPTMSYMSTVMGHVSCVTCHVSGVRCHVSGVMCQVSSVIFDRPGVAGAVLQTAS